MPYRVDPQVWRENMLRANAPENHYIGQLESRGRLIRLDNVVVDAEQMLFRTFACDTAQCLRCKGEGAAKKFKGSCCTDLEVDVTEREIAQFEQLASLARERLELGPTDPMREVVERIERKKIYEKNDKGDLCLIHIRSGRCAMSWMDGGVMRCAINTLCQRMDLPLERFKAEPCYLFPLHYVEHLPGQYFMTVMCTETIPFIGADAYVGKLRCLAKPMPGAPPAYQFLKNEIIYSFGPKLYEALDRAATAMLQEASAKRPGKAVEAAG